MRCLWPWVCSARVRHTPDSTSKPRKYATSSPPRDPNDQQTPTRLERIPPGSAQTGAAQSRYRFANPNGPTSLLRNTVAGYVIGSALNGWTFDVVNKCTPSGCGTWYRGTTYGNYNNCGFALAANIDPKTGTPHSGCPTDWQATPSSFGSSFNCSGCSGPKKVILTGPVNRFLNVQALSGGTGPFTDNQGALAAGTCVEWRYVTLNGQWVLAKWRGVDGNHGSWAYMERSSFPATLPTGQQSC